MTERAHVVVASPLQLLNAREAIARLDLGTAPRITALGSKDGQTLEQLRWVLEHTGLADRAEILTRTTPAAKWAWLRRESQRTVDTLVIGEYRLALLRELASRLRPSRLAVLDDGNATLLIHAHREGAVASQLRLSGNTKAWRHRFQRLAGVEGREPQRITYVTVYDLQSQRDDVVRHTFEELRAATPDADQEAPPAIMGSAMVSNKIIRQSEYIEIVARACEHPDPPVVYHPHRREPASLLKSVESLGLSVNPLAAPAELAFRLGPSPRRVDTFPSTLVDTLPIALSDHVPIRVLMPARDLLSPRARPGIDLVMRYARAHAARNVTFVPAGG